MLRQQISSAAINNDKIISHFQNQVLPEVRNNGEQPNFLLFFVFFAILKLQV